MFKKSRKSNPKPIIILFVIILISVLFIFSSDNNSIEFSLGPYSASAGEEFIVCADHILREDIQIIAFIPDIGKGTHHVLLDVREKPNEGIIYNCPLDNHDIFYAAGVTNDAFYFPENYAIGLKAGMTVRFQFHYQDLTNSSKIAYAKVKLATTNKNVEQLPIEDHSVAVPELPPGTSNTTVAEIPVNKNMEIIVLGAHMHDNSVFTLFKVTPNGEELIYTESDWYKNPVRWAVPKKLLIMQKGDKFKAVCEYNNPTDKTQRFPDIMCLFAYSYKPV